MNLQARTLLTPGELRRLGRSEEPAGVVLAVDVGGTEIKGALLERDGSHLALERRPTRAAEGPGPVLERTGRLMRDLAAQAPALGRGRVVGAGVAVPGVVDEVAGIARFGANISWNHVAVAEELGAKLGMPVVLSHDVRAAGLAEAYLGAARGAGNWLFIALGTGIAGAVFVAGLPVPGANGQAGEFGHLSVDPEGSSCGCGSRGCLETIASAAAIARRYAQRCPDEGGTSAKEVLQRADRGDREAAAVRDEAIEALASMILIYQGFIDPELVVIGGGLSLAGVSFFDPLRAALRRRQAFPAVPSVTAAALGGEAGCIGAGLAAWASIARVSAREPG